jgi:cell surface protein SprA
MARASCRHGTFVRFAADTVNYYEYAVPVNPGWSQEVVPLVELSGLKQISGDQDSCQVGQAFVPCFTFRREDGRLLRFVGRPSLTRVRRVVFGVRNAAPCRSRARSGSTTPRLDNVIRDVGTALRFELNAGFADFDAVHQHPGGTRTSLSIGSGGARAVNRGSGSEQRDVAIRSTMNLHKFFETSGIKLPVAFNLTENRERPEFRAGDDVVLTPEQSINQERGAVGRGYSANFSRSGSQSGVLKYTLDALRRTSANDRRGLEPGAIRRADQCRAWPTPSIRPSRSDQGDRDPLLSGQHLAVGAPEFNRSFSFDRDLDDPNHGADLGHLSEMPT